ncbi:hypothetical protein Y032_0007g3261 [Ancylostoma ceylanicum]|uniref:BZIP domain-containing protein n=1 Tax=Ancylostoma ceylanicum TaxID=53326 RepID=A0A016VP19_9BILA|nr:hypothetical protein Y032_0007g3261 [Ancylostoma ceylanicum]
MDGEKGEFQALGGSLALDQKGEFQALRGTLSLDLSACKLRNPVPATSTATNNEPRTDPTLEQKQYAQGFLDALRTVQQIHNFEFEKKVLSPGFIAPLVSTEFLTPLISPSSRDYQAILNAMVAKTPIMQPMVGTSANSSLPTGFPTAMSVPGTSSTTAAGAAPSTSAPVTTAEQLVPPKVEIKQEPRCVSEDSTESDRSRSSSTATHNTRSNRTDLELAMDEQEKRKLDRKRARNRAAATKCRQKKIDRIQELEGLVATEKQRAQNLDLEMESLRSTLHQLQQLIQMHEQRGCARS